MTVWMLAFLLPGTLAAVGYNQGAIRMGMTFAGLLTGAWLAMPLAPLPAVVLPFVGLHSPLLIWALSPFLIFVLAVIVFEVAGQALHRKVELYCKYRISDVQWGRWQRLTQQLGLCLGLGAGAGYLVLISTVLYSTAYLTTQMASGDQDPTLVRLLNRVGRDLQATGMTKVAAAVDPLPDAYYQAADIGGILHHNPPARSRLSLYPPLLALSERPEFQGMANDRDCIQMLQQTRPLAEVLHQERVKAVLHNPRLLREIWSLVQPNLKDLRAFLETGKSARYDSEKILGRWAFDVNATIAALKKKRPDLTSGQLQYYKQTVFPRLAKWTLTTSPDGHVVVKNFVPIKPGAKLAPATEPPVQHGRWQRADDGSYRLTLGDPGTFEAFVEDGRLEIAGETTPLLLQKEN